MIKYDTRLSQQDFTKIIRLLSPDNISYFGQGEMDLSITMINKVDPSIRIFSHMLSTTKCKVHFFSGGKFYSQDELKELWNKIKREEKLIRGENGLQLTAFSGSTLIYKNPTYRTQWPSFEAFSVEYPKQSEKGWMIIDVPVFEANKIKERKDLFRVIKSSTPIKDASGLEFERLELVVDVGERYLHEAEWRRITEILTLILLNSTESVA